MTSLDHVANPATVVPENLRRLSRPALWILAARVKTLSLSVVPVVAGSWSAAQAGQWRPEVALAAAGAAGAIQIGTNLWNDAADAKSGIDRADRLGPPRMTALGLLEGSQVRRAAVFVFAVAALLGIWLAQIGGWPIVLIGCLSLMLGYCYSMGPWPLSGSPLGEVLVVAFFGIVAVAGTVHLHGQPVSTYDLLLGLIIGLPAAGVLLLNNHRDRASDARAGRRTLAILIGEQASRALYAAILVCGLVVAMIYAVDCAIGLAAFLPALLLGSYLVRKMAGLPVSPALNRLIPQTAGYQVLLLVGIAATLRFCG